MDAGEALLQAAQQIEVVVKRQIRMQPAHDVEFRDRFRPVLARHAEGFIQRHRVSPGRVGLAAKGAELATRHAHVGGIDMPVDVEVGAHPVHSHADVMGQVAEGQQIVGLVKRHPVLEAQPLARQHLFGDRQQGGVFDLEVFRKHTQILILLGRGRICNWPMTEQFHRHLSIWHYVLLGRHPPNPHEH